MAEERLQALKTVASLIAGQEEDLPSLSDGQMPTGTSASLVDQATCWWQVAHRIRKLFASKTHADGIESMPDVIEYGI